MRIALVSPYSWTYPGGVTRHIEALAGRFVEEGHHVRVFAPHDPPDRLAARLHKGAWPQERALPDYVVRGYQADMAEGNWWGSIYDEKGTRGVLVNGWKGKAETVVKPNDWNTIDVIARGRAFLYICNGHLMSVMMDDSPTFYQDHGYVAIQLEGAAPNAAYFKNLWIKLLPD